MILIGENIHTQSKVINEAIEGRNPGAIQKLALQESEAGADYIKTSTGFGSAGATVEDLILLRRESAPAVKVKASGGIRGRENALTCIEAGADRIGASASVSIVTCQ